MSVTFWMPKAPTQKVQPYPDDEPDFWQDVPVAPFTEINLSNANAAAILEVIWPVGDHSCGTWDMEQLALVQRRIKLALDPQVKCLLGLEPRVEGNFFHGGRDEEYVNRRLTQFLDLVTVAIEHGYEVCYG